MFLTIEGHTVNTDQIVDITPENHIALTSGSVICISSKEEAEALRFQLVSGFSGTDPAAPRGINILTTGDSPVTEYHP